MLLQKMIDSNRIFGVIVIVFILFTVFAIYERGGRDLKVGLFGVEQILQKKSPYENPDDPHRTIFNYSPGITLLERPFLLKSRMVRPFVFEDILPSAFLWYFAVVTSLIIGALILLRIIPSVSHKLSMRNLKISYLLAMPLIGYELTNSQNKLLALFFMLGAIYLFEKNKYFLSAVSFCLALTVYFPLLSFILYFTLRGKGRFLLAFMAAASIVFIVFPSLVFGFGFNNFLLKEWFTHSLKPFLATNSYATYIDLRDSSQSLPSAVGRIFVSGHTGNFNYSISPVLIHNIIKVFSAIIILFSCLAVLKNRKEASRGLGYAIFLILALLLPRYCIYYTWSWLFVVYFALLNYMSFPEVSAGLRKILLTLLSALFIATCFMGSHVVDHFSGIFWLTFASWAGMVAVCLL